ncbi:MAG TPA: hypothetical protein VJR03_06370 [Nitrospira sp.]|nr:hypothetical protein [Nitrospira sp.]
MLGQSGIDRQVMEVIVRTPGTALDDIVLECPDLSWNQVFLVIDRLTRCGSVSLMPKGQGRYTVHLSRTCIAES